MSLLVAMDRVYRLFPCTEETKRSKLYKQTNNWITTMKKVTDITNSKSFNTKLAGVIRSATGMAANVQLLADYSILQAGKGNLTEMKDLILKTKTVKAINSRTLEKYLFASVLNVHWTTAKEGTKTIKKVADKAAKIKTVKNGVWTDFAPTSKDSKPTSLGNISTDSHNDKMAAFQARLEVTVKRDALLAQQKLLKAQLALLDAKVVASSAVAA